MTQKRAITILAAIGGLMIASVAIFAALNTALAPVFGLVLTAGLIAVTALYVYLTSRNVETANKQAEIMLNAEHNAAAPVVTLFASAEEAENITVDWKNIGKGPALNIRCWIEDDAHPELQTGQKMSSRTHIAVNEKGRFDLRTGIKGYTLGVGYVRAQYQSVFGKTYESCLIFSTNSPPELKYGEAKEDSTGKPNSSNAEQGSETQKGVALTVNRMVGYSFVVIGLSMLVTRLSEFDLTLIDHIGSSVAVMVIGLIIMSWPWPYRKKAK